MRASAIYPWLPSPAFFHTVPSWGTPSPTPSGLSISGSQNLACMLITWETARITDSRASWDADAIGPGTAFWRARLYSLPRMLFSFCSTRLCHQHLDDWCPSSGDDCGLCSAPLSGGSISALITGHHNGRNLPSELIDHSTLSGDGTGTSLLHFVSPQCLLRALPGTGLKNSY